MLDQYRAKCVHIVIEINSFFVFAFTFVSLCPLIYGSANYYY